MEATRIPHARTAKIPRRRRRSSSHGWDFPKHLSGRAFGIVVHGDAAGTEVLRRNLTDWLLDMDLVRAGNAATLDRYIGYYEPYATSHEALDRDTAVQEETRNVARSVVEAVRLMREGKYERPDAKLEAVREK